MFPKLFNLPLKQIFNLVLEFWTRPRFKDSCRFVLIGAEWIRVAPDWANFRHFRYFCLLAVSWKWYKKPKLFGHFFTEKCTSFNLTKYVLGNILGDFSTKVFGRTAAESKDATRLGLYWRKKNFLKQIVCRNRKSLLKIYLSILGGALLFVWIHRFMARILLGKKRCRVCTNVFNFFYVSHNFPVNHSGRVFESPALILVFEARLVFL
jgi:hypothetical protein